MFSVDYIASKLKKLPNGSMGLLGKRWGLVLFIMGPAFLFSSVLPKMILQIPPDDPNYMVFVMTDSVLILLTLLFVIWTPRRKIIFDSALGLVTITHAGLFKDKENIQVRARDIQELSLESPDDQNPLQRPRLILKTRDQLLYLVSLGKKLAPNKLLDELQALVSAWKQRSDP